MCCPRWQISILPTAAHQAMLCMHQGPLNTASRLLVRCDPNRSRSMSELWNAFAAWAPNRLRRISGFMPRTALSIRTERHGWIVLLSQIGTAAQRNVRTGPAGGCIDCRLSGTLMPWFHCGSRIPDRFAPDLRMAGPCLTPVAARRIASELREWTSNPVSGALLAKLESGLLPCHCSLRVSSSSLVSR